MFDRDDLWAAIDELREWYRRDEGAEFSEHLDAMLRLGNGIATGDNDRAAECLTDDFEFVQHEVFGAPGGDRRQFIDGWAVGVSEVEGDQYQFGERVLSANDRGMLVVTRQLSTTDYDFEAEWLNLTIQIFRDAKIQRIENFAVDQYAEALARFDELTAEPDELRNDASDVFRTSLARIFDNGDLEAALELIADDFVNLDQRSIVASTTGKSELAAVFGPVTASEQPVSWTFKVKSVLGDRVAVCRWGYPGDWDESFLGVIEIDGDGLCTRSVVFDPDDIEAAILEAERVFVGGEGREC